jgi:hypothetical protein
VVVIADVAAANVVVQEGRCNPLSLVDDYIYSTLCPAPTAKKHGYVRAPSPSPPDASCSVSTMSHGETAQTLPGKLGECHTVVPKQGLVLLAKAGTTTSLSLVSTRFSNMDDGPTGAATKVDVAALALAAWQQANSSAPGELYSRHKAAMGELHKAGIEVGGNVGLARVVNASLNSLSASYRNGSSWSCAPEACCCPCCCCCSYLCALPLPVCVCDAVCCCVLIVPCPGLGLYAVRRRRLLGR